MWNVTARRSAKQGSSFMSTRCEWRDLQYAYRLRWPSFKFRPRSTSTLPSVSPSPSTTLRISGVRPCRGSLPRLLLFALMLELAVPRICKPLICRLCLDVVAELPDRTCIGHHCARLDSMWYKICLECTASSPLLERELMHGHSQLGSFLMSAFLTLLQHGDIHSNHLWMIDSSWRAQIHSLCTRECPKGVEGLLVFAFGGPLKAVLSGPCAHGDFHAHQGTLSRRPFSCASPEGFAAWALELAGAAAQPVAPPTRQQALLLGALPTKPGQVTRA